MLKKDFISWGLDSILIAKVSCLIFVLCVFREV